MLLFFVDRFPWIQRFQESNEGSHGLRTHDGKDPKFFMTQTHIPIPNRYSFKKCMKSLAFCRKNAWLIKKHRLWIHSDKICGDSPSKYTPNTSQLFQPICPKRPKYLGHFWKKLSSGFRSPWGKQKSLITTDKGPHSGVSRQFQSKESSKNSNLFSLWRLDIFFLCNFPPNAHRKLWKLKYLGNLSFY